MMLVDLRIDLEAARAKAAFDLVFEARPRAVAEDAVAAGAQRDDLADRVERLTHTVGRVVGAEVLASVLDDLSGDENAWPRVVHGDFDADVGLVVLQPDVIAWFI